MLLTKTFVTLYADMVNDESKKPKVALIKSVVSYQKPSSKKVKIVIRKKTELSQEKRPGNSEVQQKKQDNKKLFHRTIKMNPAAQQKKTGTSNKFKHVVKKHSSVKQSQKEERPHFTYSARPQSATTIPSTHQKHNQRGTSGSGKRFYKGKQYTFNKKENREKYEKLYAIKKPVKKANPVPASIDIMETVTVSELARKMNLKANALITKLMALGTMATINDQIDSTTAEILASEYNCTVNVVSLYDKTTIEVTEDKEGDLQQRAPVVTVMGHVDHGKTLLLDAIRSTKIIQQEHGNITQHIGAYQVNVPQGTITFLDTPGHKAFSLMRARGAFVTDIIVLVIAANDGVMPQTKEAIDHAKEAKVPIIVAINKIDIAEANLEKVKQQLSDLGLIPEEWGGDVPVLPVSALKNEGIESLLETIILQAEIMELKANYQSPASGTVLESRIDVGRGIVSTVLIQRGILHIGDSFVAGVFSGKVRAMFDETGNSLEEAIPSRPVEVIGLDGTPNAGDPFQVTKDDKTARTVSSKRKELIRMDTMQGVKKITLDNVYEKIAEDEVTEFKLIIKGDVHGSVEALKSSLEQLSTKSIRLHVIQASVGAVNEGDVMLASASDAMIVAFQVKPAPRVQVLADKEHVKIQKYNIIYDVIAAVQSAMEEKLEPITQLTNIGTAEVKETFSVSRLGVIAGSYVTKGKIQKNTVAQVFRNNKKIYEGNVISLRRFKDDVKEVETGYECGIAVQNVSDIQAGDIIEILQKEEVKQKLESKEQGKTYE